MPQSNPLKAQQPINYFNMSVTAQDGSSAALSKYQGKVLLVVNTATGCGFTPQYEDLERIYRHYHEQGLEILDFPCNQFADQTPQNDNEINEFCSLKYNTSFPRFKKLDVNGETANPLFASLAQEYPFQGFGHGLKAAALAGFAKANNHKFGDKAYIMWNFTKFLIDREGHAVARFEPTASMDDVEAAIKKLL